MTNITLPKLNQTGTNEWTDAEDNDRAIRDVVNGNLDAANLSATANLKLSQLSTTAQQTIGVQRDYVEVLIEESTTSTLWTNLTTFGPSGTVSTVAGGIIVCMLSCEMKTTSGEARLGLHVPTDHSLSGTPVEPEILLSTSATAYTDNAFTAITAFGVTGGSRGVTLKFASSAGGTTTFKNRKLWVIAFGGF
ncbi:MAG: hypothetical protein ACRDLD_02460 [Thermoleophilaceae bacterium]